MGLASDRRTLIDDARLDGTMLRTTWHASKDLFVVSTWKDNVCTGAVQVKPSEVPDLVRVLVFGLAESAAAGSELPGQPEAEPSRSGPGERLGSLLRAGRRVLQRARSHEAQR